MEDIVAPKIVIWCNYHTKWQSVKAMRFVLVAVKWNRAMLSWRYFWNAFWTNISDLIFIETEYNRNKATLPDRDRFIPKQVRKEARKLLSEQSK